MWEVQKCPMNETEWKNAIDTLDGEKLVQFDCQDHADKVLQNAIMTGQLQPNVRFRVQKV